MRAPAAVRPRRRSPGQFGGGWGCGSQHPSAPTANPSRARDGPARSPSSQPQPSKAMHPAPAGSESTGCLAVVRGGASGRLGLPETSASGAAAIALPTSAGRSSCTRVQTPFATASESRPNSLRCLPPARRCLPPQLVMLEHLSSLPTQMVRMRPASAPRSSHAARHFWKLRSSCLRPTRCIWPERLPYTVFPILCLLGPLRLNPPESPCLSFVRMLHFPRETTFHSLPRFLWVVPDVC